MSPTTNIKIFVLCHNKTSLEQAPSSHSIEKINLNDLILPIPNSNDLAENRFFLLPESFFQSCPEYIGVLTWQFNKKYNNLLPIENLAQVIQSKMNPQLVWAASPTEYFNDGKWVEWSLSYHKTIGPYLQELSEFTNIPLANNPTIWANNFICHKSVFLDFLKFFKNVFNHFHEKYKYNFDFHVDDRSRVAAYFYERVAMFYFSNRKDLSIVKLPEKPEFNMDKILWIASSAANYEPLKNIWHESLIGAGIKDANIVHKKIKSPTDFELKVDFQSDMWYYSIRKKVENVLSVLEEHVGQNKYKYFVSTDCDIRFFKNRKNIWAILFNYIDSTNFDFYFQPENAKDLNCGFYIIKKQNLLQAIKFLKYIIKQMETAKYENLPFADQTLFQMHVSKINTCILPTVTCVAGPIYDRRNSHIYLFHHATHAYNLEMKLLQIEYIRKVHEMHDEPT